MSVLVDVVNAVNDAAGMVYEFINVGIYDLLVKFTAWFVKWSVVAWFKVKLAALEFSWDVAQELITSLNISQHLDQAWSHLDSKTLSLAAYFRIPEAINIILSAATTKFVFRFLGF